MKKLLAWFSIFLLIAVGNPAFAQTNPSPIFQDVTVNGTFLLNGCTGYPKATAGSMVGSDCQATVPTADVETGTSGTKIPLLDGANTWSGAQVFAGISSSLMSTISGSAPGISSCGGGSPSVATGSSNNAGKFTTGTSASACTITFANSGWPNYAFCTVSNASAANTGLYISAQSKTAFTITYTSGSTISFQYVCFGN